METTKYLKINELAELLFNVELKNGMPTFAKVVQKTEPKCTKKCRITGTPNPYNKIEKLSEISILLNSDYVTAVTNQLDREGKEETDYKKGQNTMPLVFGANNQFIGIFNDEAVLQYRPNDNIKPKVTYFCDNEITDKKEIEGYLPKVYEATNQGTEREIFWRKLYLKNLVSLTFNKVTYILVQ